MTIKTQVNDIFDHILAVEENCLPILACVQIKERNNYTIIPIIIVNS